MITVTMMKKPQKTRVRIFKNKSGKFPGGSLIGGNFPGGRFPDTEENICQEF